MKGAIYSIKNLCNEKQYIGQTLNLCKRKSYHFIALRNGSHSNLHLQSAFTKYGENNFMFNVLEKVSENLLDIRECFWISFYKSNERKFGYNLESGGSLLKHHSEETKIKISKSKKGQGLGRSLSIEHRIKIGLSNKGKKFSEEICRKISERQLGKKRGPFSEEHKMNMSLCRKGIPPPPQCKLACIKANTGSHHSIEHCKKISDGLLKHYFKNNKTEGKRYE
ncbi:MAG: GIY-YIG nuclease family protein [Eubacteriales bacterium]